METLGERIRYAREAKGLSQSDIARHFGISRISVLNWEHDDTRPKVERIQKLAEVLGVSEEWLLSAKGKPPTRRRKSVSKIDELLEGFPKLEDDDQDRLLDMMRRLASHASSEELDSSPPERDREKS